MGQVVREASQRRDATLSVQVRKRWRKLKGVAQVRVEHGGVRLAELHWYEAHGLGRRKMKIRRFLD